MLNNNDRQQLADIERRLRAEDPKLAAAFEGRGSASRRARSQSSPGAPPPGAPSPPGAQAQVNAGPPNAGPRDAVALPRVGAPGWLTGALVVMVILAVACILLGLPFAALLFVGMAALAYAASGTSRWPPWDRS